MTELNNLLFFPKSLQCSLYLCKVCGCVIHPISTTLQETEGKCKQGDKRHIIKNLFTEYLEY